MCQQRNVARCATMGLAALALASLPAPAAAAGGGGSAADSLTASQFASASSVVTVGLILFSIGFEKAEHFMLHRPSKVTRPVVRSMFQELTGLGFLGVFLFVVESTPAVSFLSKAVFGDSHADTLAHVIHEVHMALFLVLCVFLVNVLVLMLMAMRQQKTWAARELACVDRKQLVSGYSSFLSTHRRANCCLRLFRYVCAEQDEAYERVVYNALRARFLRPGGKSRVPTHHHEVEEDGTTLISLNASNANAYRKKLTVYAFQSRDPCRFDKHWGVSQGAGGDFVIVGVDGDVYSCPKKLFEETYVAVTGEPNKYRKVGVMYARHMTHAFKVRTASGVQRGTPGSYLLQDPKTGQQYSVTAVEFESLYEPAEDNRSLHRDAKDLPRDFDFGAYLTERLGATLGEIVTLEWHTWCIILVMVFILWLTLLAEDDNLFFIVNHGMGIAWAACNLAFMRKMYAIRDYLIPRMLLRRSGARTVPSNAEAAHKHASTPAPLVATTPDNGAVVALGAVSEGSGAMEEGKLTPYVEGDGGDAAGVGAAKSTPSLGGEHKVADMSAETRQKGLKKQGSSFMADPDPSDLRSVVVDHNVLTGSHEGAMPLYVDLTLEAPKDKSCMFRYFFKRPANRHEKLFWFGARGPEMVKEFVRANILFMSMFLAVNCMILARLECELDNLCPLRFVLIFVPQIMNVFMLPRLITSYVLVANIELLRKNKVVQEVNRKQRTQKSMRALRLLSALRSYAKKHDGSVGTAAGHGHKFHAVSRCREVIHGAAVRVYGKPGTANYIRRRHEFKEAFAIFDRESNGHVRVENIQSLFELLGLAESAESAARAIVAELDVDGRGSVEFEEFFDWTAAQHEDVDTHALTRDIFNIIDRDRSEDITATELRDTLSSLGAVMSPEDIMRTVADADHDGSGTIGFHEFEALMRKHMKAESM